MSDATPSSRTALVILVDGVEELEAVAPIDCLRRADVKVTIASATEQTRVAGKNGIQLVADSLLGQADKPLYDLIVIPGGPGHKTLAANKNVLRILQHHAQSGKLIGSICAGPVVLKQAGVLAGHAYTSHPTTGALLPGRDPQARVVRDRNIITSQGAGTAVDFSLSLVEALCGRALRDEVAASICS